MGLNGTIGPIPHPESEPSEFHKIIANGFDDKDLDNLRTIQSCYERVAEVENTEQPNKSLVPYDQEADSAEYYWIGAYVRIRVHVAKDADEAEDMVESWLTDSGYKVIYVIEDPNGEDDE